MFLSGRKIFIGLHAGQKRTILKSEFFPQEKDREMTEMAGNESAENYLETILILSRRLPVVRSVDIANELGFRKPSVSVAMKNLREKKQICVDGSGFITLTPSGREIAEMIYERHQFLSGWLTGLGVPADTAVEDACRIEHVISPESFDAIRKFVSRSASYPADDAVR